MFRGCIKGYVLAAATCMTPAATNRCAMVPSRRRGHWDLRYLGQRKTRGGREKKGGEGTVGKTKEEGYEDLLRR